MNPVRNKNVARFVIGSISLLLVSVGCGNAPEYRYQSASAEVKSPGGAEANKEAAAKPSGDTGGHASAAITKEGEPAAVSGEPDLPEVTVGDILQNDKSFSDRKIRVTGRIGKIMPLYNMAFILNTKNDRYIELSYGQIADAGRSALTRLDPLQKITILGVWDASKRVFIGEELVSSSQ